MPQPRNLGYFCSSVSSIGATAKMTIFVIKNNFYISLGSSASATSVLFMFHVSLGHNALSSVTFWGPPRGGGVHVPLFLKKKLEFPLFPCSPKISEDVPLNSVLLSSSVPINSIACSLDPQQYSLKFPKIPNVFQFLMISNFITFTSPFKVEIIIQPQQNAFFVSLMNVALPHAY